MLIQFRPKSVDKWYLVYSDVMNKQLTARNVLESK